MTTSTSTPAVSADSRDHAENSVDGTVTFLFAGTAAASAVEGSVNDSSTHFRRVVEESGGRQLDATAESFPAVFRSPAAALAAARRLLGLDDGLRIGIHSGEPLTIEDGRYFGAAVWIAARLCGRAEPGTILVSGTTRALLAPFAARSLTASGTARLKGIALPVEVWTATEGEGEGSGVGVGDAVFTVLQVDQVGSTSVLDERGDVGARTEHRALMELLREAVEDHDGLEVEYGGDGLAVRFASALPAVDCARTMQRAVRRHRRRFPTSGLRIRVALATGQDVPNADGVPSRIAATASALLKRADAEDVLLEAVTAALTGDRHEFALRASGDGASVALDWQAEETGPDLPPALRRIAPFVGRTEELERLDDAWSHASRAERQRLVVLRGAAGTGKTALAAVFGQRLRVAAPDASIVLHGRAAELETQPMEALVDAVSGAVSGATRADARRLLGPYASSLGPLLGVAQGSVPAGAPPSVPEVAAGLDHVLTALSQEAPVLLVLDDLQKASPSLLAGLRVLLRTSERRLVVLGLLRSVDGPPAPFDVLLEDVPADAVVERLVLPELDFADATDLLAALGGDQRVLGADASSADRIPAALVARAEAGLRDALEQAISHGSEPGRPGSDAGASVATLTEGLAHLQRLHASGDPGHARTMPESTQANPYQGLRAFDAEQAAWFFGRERMTAELLARVATSRIVGVVGASGSGKSSLVRAGLLPALASGALPGGGGWTTAAMVPGSRPLDALTTALAAALDADVGVLRTRLRRDGLATVLTATADDGRLLLLVDQAEELFTSAVEAERDRFVELLESAVDAGDRLVVVLTMRSEFYGAWGAYPRLADRLQRDHLLVRAMLDDEIRSAVVAPAALAGLRVEPALVDAIVADVTGEAGALPLLSTALSETWQRRRGRTLTLRGYAEAGGVRGAVARLADATFARFSTSQQEVAQNLLLRLAQPAAPGAAADLRRRAPIDEVLGIGGEAPEVLHALVDDRLVTADASTVEVSHEALLRDWPLLRSWLDEDRAGRAVQQELADDALSWARSERDPGRLYQGSRLAVALEVAAMRARLLSIGEREFLAASAARAEDELHTQRRSTRRFRRLSIGLVVVLVGALVAGGAAGVQGVLASRRAVEARSEALAAQSAALLPAQQDVAGLLALASQRLHPSSRGTAALVAAAVATPSLQRIVPLGGAATRVQAVSADGRVAMVVGQDGDVRAVRIDDGRVLGRIRVEGSFDNVFVSISRTGRYFAALTGSSSDIVVQDVERDRTMRIADASGGFFLADDVLVYTEEDGSLAYFDPGRGAKAEMSRADGDGGGAASSVDGRVFATTGTPVESTASAVASYGRPVTHLSSDRGRSTSSMRIDASLVGLSPDGTRIAVLDGARLEFLDTATRRTVASADVSAALSTTFLTALHPVLVGVFDPAGDTLAFEGQEPGNPLHLVDVRTGRQQTIPLAFPHRTYPPAIDSDGRIVVQMETGVAVLQRPTVLPAATGSTRAALEVRSPFPRALLAVDPSGRALLRAEDGIGAAAVRYRVSPADAPASGPILTADPGWRFDGTTAAFDQRGDRVATVELRAEFGRVVVWETGSGRRVAATSSVPLADPEGAVHPLDRVAFISGTDEVAAVVAGELSSGEPEARVSLFVWHTTSPRSSAPMFTMDLGLNSLSAFSPDGADLALIGGFQFRLIDVRTGAPRGDPVSVPGSNLYGNELPRSDYEDLTFSTDGGYVTTGSSQASEDSVVRFTTTTPIAVQRIVLPNVADDGVWAISPDGTRVANVSPNGIQFRAFSTSSTVEEVPVGNAGVLTFTRSGDAVVLASGTQLSLVYPSGESMILGAYAAVDPGVVADDPEALPTADGVVVRDLSGAQSLVDSYVTRPAAVARRVCRIAGRDITRAEWMRYVPDQPYRALCP